MGNLVSHSADEPDNRRAPTSTAELPTERDNDAGPALGARPNQEREPAARRTSSKLNDRASLVATVTLAISSTVIGGRRVFTKQMANYVLRRLCDDSKEATVPENLLIVLVLVW